MSELELIKQISRLQRQVNGLVKPEVGRWADWTPTVTQGVAVTRTIEYARYYTSGPLVVLQAKLNVTSGGTSGSAIVIAGVPAAIAPINVSGTAISVIGTIDIQDTSVAQYIGALVAFGANDLRGTAHLNTGYIGQNPTFALANTDVISFMAAYERA